MTEVASPKNDIAQVFEVSLEHRQGDKQQWGGLSKCAASFACSSAAYEHKSCSLVITPDIAGADKVEKEIKIAFKGRSNPPTVMQFPDWETLPYDSFSPHQDIISERMRCLYQLTQGERGIVVISATTLLQRLIPDSHIRLKSLVLSVGAPIARESFRHTLIEAGYLAVDTVFQHGEFAVRGSLIDVYPMGSPHAYRIEVFDDTVESLRQFDPETQRTIDKVTHIELLPGKECPLDDEGILRFKANWHEHFDVDHRACSVYQDVSDGISPAGVEYYLPLFFESTSTLFDYLPKDSLVFIMEGFEAAMESHWRECSQRFDNLNIDVQRPLLPPAELFIPVNELYSQLKFYQRVTIQSSRLPNKQGNKNFGLSPAPNLLIDSKASQPLYRLQQVIQNKEYRILFCAESNGRKETLKESLAKIDQRPNECASIHEFVYSTQSFAITVADIDDSILLEESAILLLSESSLYGVQVQQRRRRNKTSNEDSDAIIKNLTELKVGAPVVHIEHGVGRYMGLQSIAIENMENEFLTLEYADQAKLYVPVTSLHLISRYSGSEESTAPIHRLGSEHWRKAKRKAAEKIRDVAAELLEIYAKREAREGFAYENPKHDYEMFASTFPFEVTPDQDAAIEAVRQDMLSSKPMDRLICGDVGFGKTEVAMRAAFIAVQNNKQVVILVPTTLLAQQHYENIKDRFADWPVKVDLLSRFRTQKEVTATQKSLASGSTDIVVGTHKLIQGGIDFPRLGLLIIDEEHRFGVRQKEKLKALRAEVDILTMTATPIPRTLNMSMSGMRDLSIIATPPAKRLSIKTFVREQDNTIIKEAILREIKRGGQVYYLHNQVQTIEKVAADLRELIPEGRIKVGHGQMRERELEAVMSDFYHKRFNILVCTTIIETGIDVPSANTIIIDRADKFGLAQLHQLRGRVGRSHHQAYAYLLTPHRKAMTKDAHKRLEAISEAQELGAGFTLASHDMEIRGAGELLGDEQSGQIETIGFSLYMSMLDKAVKAIKEGKTIDLDDDSESNTDINLKIPALIPDDYIPDVHTRLTLYKRLSAVKSENQLEEMQVEMIDRFGLLPDASKNLIRQTRLRLEAEELGICKVEVGASGGRIEFAKDTQVNPMTIVKLVQSQPQNYRLEGATHLRFSAKTDTPNDRIQAIHKLFANLAKAS